MTNTKRLTAVCGFLLICSGCCGMPDNVGVKSELHGLSTSIQRIDRVGPEVEVVYGLEWSSSAPSWDLKPIEPVIPTFRDLDGSVLPARPATQISLDDRFLRLETKQTSTTLRVSVPVGARTLSLSLGASGLETPRVEVP